METMWAELHQKLNQLYPSTGTLVKYCLHKALYGASHGTTRAGATNSSAGRVNLASRYTVCLLHLAPLTTISSFTLIYISNPSEAMLNKQWT